MNNLTVQSIPPEQCKPWLLKKHYAKRVPSITDSFGLYQDNNLIGIITYGIPANNNLNEVCGFPAIELNRLCINDDAPRNTASFLVGNSLKMLSTPRVIISYADLGQGHIGYVYQATNWIYTGLGSADIEFEKDGKTWHRKALFNIYGPGGSKRFIEMGFTIIEKAPKFRYLFFLGSKKERKQMMNNLKWPIEPYPKGETKRYDAGDKLPTQDILF
jgi:hypothetical protein